MISARLFFCRTSVYHPGVVYRHDPGGRREDREQLVSYSVRLLDDGLAVGSAGNMSVRAGDEVLITPSGIAYREMGTADICAVAQDGTVLSAPAEPSSETPMHLAVYAATQAGAVVHTHSPEVIALSAVSDELPAIHYAITGLGGPVRVAGYTRFGSGGLARAAVAALEGRRAAILQNHGAICYGATLAEAYDRALLLEWLAHVHRLACARGTPRILTEEELAEVTAEVRRRRYGEARGSRADVRDGG
jgi:L-fuculose-phosphate aldolase